MYIQSLWVHVFSSLKGWFTLKSKQIIFTLPIYGDTKDVKCHTQREGIFCKASDIDTATMTMRLKVKNYKLNDVIVFIITF